MLIVRWTDEALLDLEEIVSFIAERNAFAALQLQRRIEYAAERLPLHPYMHRPGRLARTREAIVHPNYILVYQVAEAIEVLAVLHARQRYP